MVCMFIIFELVNNIVDNKYAVIILLPISYTLTISSPNFFSNFLYFLFDSKLYISAFNNITYIALSN